MAPRISFSCLLAVLAAATGAHASVIADSIADFSGVQGQGGWYYGYYHVGETRDAFQLMTQFDGDRWWVDPSSYWTMIGPIGAHSNGTITSGFALPEEQWAARRWISSSSGPIDVAIDFAKINIGSASNGVTGRIFVDGSEIWNQYVGASDAAGIAPTLHLDVVPGTTIDFVLDPTDSNDWSDNSRFSAVISTVPAPAAAGLLSLAGLVSSRRRRPSN